MPYGVESMGAPEAYWHIQLLGPSVKQ